MAKLIIWEVRALEQHYLEKNNHQWSGKHNPDTNYSTEVIFYPQRNTIINSQEARNGNHYTMERNGIMEKKQHGKLHKLGLSVISRQLYWTEFCEDRKVKHQMYYLNCSNAFDKSHSKGSCTPKSTQIGFGWNTMMWPQSQRLFILKTWNV